MSQNTAMVGLSWKVFLVKVLPWLLSVLWLLLPWSVGNVFVAGSTDSDRLFTVTIGTGLWAAWGVALLASLIRRPWALTMLRLASTGAVAVTLAAVIWVANSDDIDGTGIVGAGSTSTASATTVLSTAAASLAVAHVVVIAAVSLLPEIGNTFVDGLSYGNESRLLLRAPVGVLVGPLPLAWAFAIAGIAAGPLALANRQWVLAIVLAVLGWPVAVVATRSLHQLAMRWIVFVPNGLVLVDQLATREPVLLLRKNVALLAPTPASVDLTVDGLADLSGNALGIPLMASLEEPVAIIPRHTKKFAEQLNVSEVLFSPTRPGAALVIAVERKIGVDDRAR